MLQQYGADAAVATARLPMQQLQH
jgi:hypothetical protein